MPFKKSFFLLCSISSLLSFSQVKIGQWVDHLSYTSSNSVAKVNNLVYVSNGSGLAKYNTDDNSIEKMTKIDGLSDIGVKLLRKCDYNNSLLVIYDNTNMDVIKSDGTIVNISDIKRKIITGKKYINEVYFNANFAYISCGFGIILFDTEKLEIKDTYYIGNGITNKEIYQSTRNDTAIFAATESGIYYGALATNLSNFQNWKSLNTGIAAGPYNSIVNFNGKILANYSARLNSNSSMADTIYQYDGVVWGKYPYKSNTENKRMLDFSKYNKLLIVDQYGLQDIDANGNHTQYITSYGSGVYADIRDVAYENNGHFWLADHGYGFVHSQGGPPYPSEIIHVNGPLNNLVNDIDIRDGVLAVAPTNLGDTYTYQYNATKPSVYKDKEWSNLKSVIADTLKDINSCAVDPNDKTHIVYGCMIQGVINTKNNQFVNVYHTGNTPLVGMDNGTDLRVTGVNFDKNSNLWVSITLGTKCVAVLKKNNTWSLLNFEQTVVKPTITKIIFDKYDQAWMILARGVGMMVYKDVNGLSAPNTSNTKMVTVATGGGKLPTNDVSAVCEDLTGHIWVGTAQGIAVFYNPENVFTGSNWDSQQILIEQDGHVQILLENDRITGIAVDGANRKWIGTESSGVYCLSPDGQKEIHHFTIDNSPLYSNLIRDIVTDETTGDVFIATEKGIQSYRTSIIKGFEDFKNVHAYPNPVRPGYSGSVSITGLIDEAIVKITDIAGNLVWQTKSEGGQIEWNLQNFNGTHVASGVYMVYCASASGDKSATAKLMVIN